VEIYEAARKATATRLVLLIFNVAMVAYLLWDLWQQRRLRGPGCQAVAKRATENRNGR